MNETKLIQDDKKYVIELLETLPDHWYLMPIMRMGGSSWRVYNSARELVAEADDLETALNLALT